MDVLRFTRVCMYRKNTEKELVEPFMWIPAVLCRANLWAFSISPTCYLLVSVTVHTALTWAQQQKYSQLHFIGCFPLRFR